jgi:hypothetical protein
MSSQRFPSMSQGISYGCVRRNSRPPTPAPYSPMIVTRARFSADDAQVDTWLPFFERKAAGLCRGGSKVCRYVARPRCDAQRRLARRLAIICPVHPPPAPKRLQAMGGAGAWRDALGTLPDARPRDLYTLTFFLDARRRQCRGRGQNSQRRPMQNRPQMSDPRPKATAPGRRF